MDDSNALRKMVLDTIVMPIVKEENGKQVIYENDLDELKLSLEQRKLCIDIMKKNNIEFRTNFTTSKEGTHQVSDFDYNEEIPTDLFAMNFDLRERIFKSLDTLSSRERIVLIMKFGLDGEGCRTFEEIAQEITKKDETPVSSERVKQIYEKSIRKIFQPTKIKSLTSYYDSKQKNPMARKQQLAELEAKEELDELDKSRKTTSSNLEKVDIEILDDRTELLEESKDNSIEGYKRLYDKLSAMYEEEVRKNLPKKEVQIKKSDFFETTFNLNSNVSERQLKKIFRILTPEEKELLTIKYGLNGEKPLTSIVTICDKMDIDYRGFIQIWNSLVKKISRFATEKSLDNIDIDDNILKGPRS